MRLGRKAAPFHHIRSVPSRQNIARGRRTPSWTDIDICILGPGGARMVSRNAKIPRARRGPNESLMSVGWAARIPLAPFLPRPRPYSVTVGIRGSSSSFQLDLVVCHCDPSDFSIGELLHLIKCPSSEPNTLPRMSRSHPWASEEYGWGKRTRKGAVRHSCRRSKREG